MDAIARLFSPAVFRSSSFVLVTEVVFLSFHELVGRLLRFFTHSLFIRFRSPSVSTSYRRRFSVFPRNSSVARIFRFAFRVGRFFRTAVVRFAAGARRKRHHYSSAADRVAISRLLPVVRYWTPDVRLPVTGGGMTLSSVGYNRS